MIISGDTIHAEDDMHLVRRADGKNFGKIIVLGYTYYLNGEKLSEPLLETPSDFDEVED